MLGCWVLGARLDSGAPGPPSRPEPASVPVQAIHHHDPSQPPPRSKPATTPTQVGHHPDPAVAVLLALRGCLLFFRCTLSCFEILHIQSDVSEPIIPGSTQFKHQPTCNLQILHTSCSTWPPNVLQQLHRIRKLRLRLQLPHHQATSLHPVKPPDSDQAV